VDAGDRVIGGTRWARQALGGAGERALGPVPAADLLGGTNQEQLGGVERGLLQRALSRSQGNVSAAAKALGISRATLHRKLKQLAIKQH